MSCPSCPPHAAHQTGAFHTHTVCTQTNRPQESAAAVNLSCALQLNCAATHISQPVGAQGYEQGWVAASTSSNPAPCQRPHTTPAGCAGNPRSSCRHPPEQYTLAVPSQKPHHCCCFVCLFSLAASAAAACCDTSRALSSLHFTPAVAVAAGATAH